MANVNINQNNKRYSTKNSILYNSKPINSQENYSRKNSNNYEMYYKTDENFNFSESDDFDGRDSLNNGANKIRKVTLSKSNTLLNQPLNNLGKGSFLYHNANTVADIDARRPSFLDENFTHKVISNIFFFEFLLIKNKCLV